MDQKVKIGNIAIHDEWTAVGFVVKTNTAETIVMHQVFAKALFDAILEITDCRRSMCLSIGIESAS